MEWCLKDLTRTPHDTYMCRNTLPTQSSQTVLTFILNEIRLVCILGLGVSLKDRTFVSLSEGNSSLSFMVSRSGDWQFEPFQEAQGEVAPRHWHGHGNRWNYSFPMVWPPFPGPLWGTCVCQWDMGQMVAYLYPDCCQENLHPFGNKKGVLLVHLEKKNGDFIDDTSSYSLSFVGLCVSN